MDRSHKFSNLNMARRSKTRRIRKDNELLTVLEFYVLPFIVINTVIFILATVKPDFTLTVSGNDGFSEAQIVVKTKGIFPPKTLYFVFNNEELEYKKVSSNTYSALVSANGTLEVYEDIFNGMAKTSYENISCIDDTPPTIIENINEEGHVSVYVSDSQSGIDYDGIYAVIEGGEKITPGLIDKGSGAISFSYDSSSIEIHVFDNNGQESIATYTTIEVSGN